MTTTADAVAGKATASPVKRLWAPATASAVVLSATLYTGLGDPYSEGHFPGCMWVALSGFWCPGCGGLRATHELFHGDVAAALALNPVVVLVILPLGVVALALWWRSAWMGRPFPRIPMWLAIGLPSALAVFWVARNIPVLEPFLAP